MIYGVIGLPRAGKTTFLTACATHWQNGKKYMHIPPAPVYTNFWCPGCYKLDFDTLGLYHYSDCNILIDEIMLLADNRNFKTFPEHLKMFFALHGHFHVNVIWCSQNWDCDRKIRSLTQQLFLLERGKILTNFSFVKPIYRKISVEKSMVSEQFTVGAPLEWVPIYRPKYYQNFDSFETNELQDFIPEKWEQKQGVI